MNRLYPLPVLTLLISLIINLDELYPILFFMIRINDRYPRLSALAFQGLAGEFFGFADLRRLNAEVGYVKDRPAVDRQLMRQSPTLPSFLFSSLLAFQLLLHILQRLQILPIRRDALRFPALRIERVVMFQRQLLRHFMRYFSGMGQHFPLVEGQESIELVSPFRHGHGLSALGLILGIIQVHDHDTIEFGDLRLVEIVLGNGDILPPYPAAVP